MYGILIDECELLALNDYEYGVWTDFWDKSSRAGAFVPPFLTLARVRLTDRMMFVNALIALLVDVLFLSRHKHTRDNS